MTVRPLADTNLKQEGERSKTSSSFSLGFGVLVLVALCGGVFALHHVLGETPRKDTLLAGFATSLNGRTTAQKHNAKLAASAINGKVIRPGEVFSFNRCAKSWTWDRGYVKAPVSFNGDLIKAYGGGVCQTSTTLYNAALLAGLPVLERHCHVFAPSYIPPGRDAAVAQYDIDLRFKNPYSWNISLQAEANESRVEVRILGMERPKQEIQIRTEVLSATNPSRLTRVVQSKSSPRKRVFVRNPGAVGYRVLTYRTFWQGEKETQRERLSDDSYQAMDRIVQVNEEEMPLGGS
jgi:vancomycin resistance protein YoaR